MTVEQLIKRLESLPPKLEIYRFVGGAGIGTLVPFKDQHIQFTNLDVVIY